MRGPIAYGLSWPQRIASGTDALDFSAMAGLSFETFDSPGHQARFPGLRLAWDALASAPGTTAVLNAANEIAVAAFLDARIRFDQIHAVNRETLEGFSSSSPASLQAILALDAEARSYGQQVVQRLAR
jgi:1-deoxy-D-xylulose-5-phosphate reductoisomerase